MYDLRNVFKLQLNIFLKILIVYLFNKHFTHWKIHMLTIILKLMSGFSEDSKKNSTKQLKMTEQKGIQPDCMKMGQIQLNSQVLGNT